MWPVVLIDRFVQYAKLTISAHFWLVLANLAYEELCEADEMQTFSELQTMIEATFGTRDRARGQAGTVAWLCEEVGELAKAARKGTRAEQLHELSDVLAWTASLANQLGLSMEEALSRYANGCPRCSSSPCGCP
jgi:NTP pyrophosphatase (non-canonical NTP hydrolase)